MAIAKRGAFIVFEGIDRVGKSSQCRMLVDSLQMKGHSAEVFRFPDRTTEIGKRIDSYLQNKTDVDDRIIHLLFSLNRHECSRKILETLKSGTTIVCDRYVFSGAAYTMAKGASSESGKHEFTYEWCIDPDVGLPQPDMIIFLDMEVEVALKRADFGGERYEKREFQEKIRANFHQIKARTEGKDGGGWGLAWKEIDATKSVEEIAALVSEYAQPQIEKISSTSVVYLTKKSLALSKGCKEDTQKQHHEEVNAAKAMERIQALIEEYTQEVAATKEKDEAPKQEEEDKLVEEATEASRHLRELVLKAEEIIEEQTSNKPEEKEEVVEAAEAPEPEQSEESSKPAADTTAAEEAAEPKQFEEAASKPEEKEQASSSSETGGEGSGKGKAAEEEDEEKPTSQPAAPEVPEVEKPLKRLEITAPHAAAKAAAAVVGEKHQLEDTAAKEEGEPLAKKPKAAVSL